MDRSDTFKLLSMYALIASDTETINCVANYVKLGGDINEYVNTHVANAKTALNGWIHDQPITTPPPQKRKYTRRNLNPELQLEDNNTIKIYCEGTCSNIGKPDAKAGFGIFCHITADGDIFTRDVVETLKAEEPQSNQRAELRALYAGILLGEEVHKEFPTCKVEIIVSSMYAHRSIYEWAEGWKKKDWKGVSHIDVLRPIIEKINVPCRLIKKDSVLTGYIYARESATKSTVQTETPCDVSM